MNKYFRVKALYPKNNMAIVADSYGKFDEIWQLSAFLIKKGFKILEVFDNDKIPDTELPRVDTVDKEHIIIRDCKEVEL